MICNGEACACPSGRVTGRWSGAQTQRLHARLRHAGGALQAAARLAPPARPPPATAAELVAAARAAAPPLAYLDLGGQRLRAGAGVVAPGPAACLAGELALLPGMFGTPAQARGGRVGLESGRLGWAADPGGLARVASAPGACPLLKHGCRRAQLLLPVDQQPGPASVICKQSLQTRRAGCPMGSSFTSCRPGALLHCERFYTGAAVLSKRGSAGLGATRCT
jgi:hypothetical protein